MNNDMIETLISKFIDSEITPAEQRLLDAELMSNPNARELLTRLQQLRVQTCQLLDEQLTGRGASAESLFQKACEQIDSPRQGQRFGLSRFAKLAISLAACLLVALTVWAIVSNQTPNDPTQQPEKIMTAKDDTATPESLEPRFKPRWVREITPTQRQRYMDWYIYTDPSGSQYLIESYRDHGVTTASANDGL